MRGRFGMDEGDIPPIPATPQLIESPKITNIHGLVAEQLQGVADSPEDDSDEIMARKILDGTLDDIDYREYANLLGSKEMSGTLSAFIELLKPLPDSLLASLRKLVSKVYFIAEAQNIDRILEELGKQWVECHPDSFWGGHYRLCHIVLFSLLILNSDLHNGDNVGGQAKFSQEQFIENTLYALKKDTQATGYTLEEVEPLIEEQLASYYESLKEKCLALSSKPLSRDDSGQQLRRNARGLSNLQLGKRSSRFSVRSVTMTSLETTSSNGTSIYSNSSSRPIEKESHFTSNWKFHHNKPLTRLYYCEPFDEEMNTKRDTLWFMDSLIKLSDNDLIRSKSNEDQKVSAYGEHFNKKDPRQFFRWLTKGKAKSIFDETKSPIAFLDGNTRWVKARVRIFEGRIYIFRLKSGCNATAEPMQNLDLLKKNSTQYFVYNLFEALATLVQENVVEGHCQDKNSLTKDHATRGNFTLALPIGFQGERTAMEFQTRSVDEAHKFVQCINFWAARLTSVPSAQFELVSNEEYGWSSTLLSLEETTPENLDRINLSSWKPLLSISSLYDELQTSVSDQPNMATRLAELTNFTEKVQERIDLHNKYKPAMIRIWTHSKHFDKAMDNWNKKYLYLNEINQRSSTYLEVMNLAQALLHKTVNQEYIQS